MTLHDLLKSQNNWSAQRIMDLYNDEALRLNYVMTIDHNDSFILRGRWSADGDTEHTERYPYCLTWWQNYAQTTAIERRDYPDNRYPTFDIPWNTSGCQDPDHCAADTSHYLHDREAPPTEGEAPDEWNEEEE